MTSEEKIAKIKEFLGEYKATPLPEGFGMKDETLRRLQAKSDATDVFTRRIGELVSDL